MKPKVSRVYCYHCKKDLCIKSKQQEYIFCSACYTNWTNKEGVYEYGSTDKK